MKKYLILLICCMIFISCQNEFELEDDIDLPGDSFSFPGALDSIYAYADIMDSTDFQLAFIYRIKYDSLKRVVRIDYDADSYNNFVYTGNAMLPAKMIDARPDPLAGKISVDSITYTYDAQNRVVEKRIQNYLLEFGVLMPRYAERVIDYEYGNGYMFEGTSCRSDTIFLNSNGDPVKKIHNCFISNPYEERVDEYYTFKNPFATLNIAPIRRELYGFNNILWYPLDDVDYTLNEPTYLYKKISGYYYYTSNPMDDEREIRFHPVTDANGRVNKFTVANSHNQTDFNGTVTNATFYTRFKFFYKQ